MMEPIIEPFINKVKKVTLNPPHIPFISNVTGTWITAKQATDPDYWATHLRQTVQFTVGISTLQQEPNRILLEVGPGRTLCTFAQKHSDVVGLCSLRHPKEKQSDVTFLLNTLGKLWLYGVQVNWSGFYTNERRYRLPLPTYPFERQRYWIHAQKQAHTIGIAQITQGKKPDIADWFYLPLWKQSVGKQHITDELQMTVVSNNMHSVIGEEGLCPEKATVLGAVKIIPQEYPNISCRSIDVVIPKEVSWQQEKLVEQLLNELQAQSSDIVIAYRSFHRWVQTFEPVRLEGGKGETSRLRQGGVYLITGGLGGVGLALASYLAKEVRVKLVLIGRSHFPAKEEWEQWLATHDEKDSVSHKIWKVKELEELGAEVLVFSADVANLKQMQQAIAKVQEQFGQINGVIHCAGVPDYAGVISRRTREITESIMAPKVRGTLVLDSLLKNVELDFFILCSSLSSILSRKKFSEVGYCAANEFLDAFAYYKTNKDRIFTVAINWTDWQDVGMSVEAVKRFVRGQEISNDKSLLIDALFPYEGIEVFRRILNSAVSRIVVSTQDLTTLIERDRDFNAQDLLESLGKANFSKPTHPRPELSNAYLAPRNETEQTIAEIWQKLLGIELVGIYDNFFELGGDSLLIVQVRSQLQKVFKQDLLTTDLFEYPTVSALAGYLWQEQIEKLAIQPVYSRAKRQEKAIEEEAQMMKQRRKAHG
ncbi:SDR family NAD(P)-dependent oxidoreductase [Nostoc sp. CHAB 5715]|uniref:SDR family NAD(P)-dependent oxidoreductase n=1 Tax=Nostoc sp. CHAB 5715 TaxID=2780400 RepID=UPI001E606A99|nr:SDR family NAD(P)-dependent oxidoreductase [Nostoc sp. CHAB 5715]MCC5623184.1 SDR family NAD(P)-dependent oxidoreductase [Nostoc sp. CHAB 5715]